MANHIVIVEDEIALAQNYKQFLEQKGFCVSLFSSVTEAKAAFEKQLPDLAILDIELGHDIDGGFTLCQFLRQQSHTLPIMFLTARDDEIDAISGLRLGADDFLNKDISLIHLCVRIQTLLRRSQLQSTPHADTIKCIGKAKINHSQLQFHWQDQLIDLTVTEFWIITCLLQHPGQVKNRQQLMDAANTVLDDNTITAHIKRIRKKFKQVDRSFNCINTVYGMGYRWINQT